MCVAMRQLGCVFIGLLLLFQVNACGSKTSPVTQDTVLVQEQTQFPFPAIPEVLTSPDERKTWLLIHYWDQFDFADTTLVNNRDVTEQGFVNFIALLADGTTPEELARESLENWCAGFVGKDHARKVLTQTADDYLFNPNSPFRGALRDVSGGVAWQAATDGCDALRLPLQAGAGKAQ